MKPEENTFPILAVQTTYKCNMLCANCYLGDMLNNPKFLDVDPIKLEEVFKKLEADGIDPVLFGLTDKDFELLAKNFAKIRNQLKVQNDLIDKYKQYYESEEDNNE